MIAPLYRFIARQSPEELARQYALLSDSGPIRLVMTLLAYVLSAIFVPLWFVVCCVAVDLWSDVQGTRLMRGLHPAEKPWAYLGTLAAVLASELAFMSTAAIAFQQDSAMAKPFAVGIATLTMLQLGSVRAIHRIYADAGVFVAFSISVAATLFYWHDRGDLPGFLVTQVAIGAAAYFIREVISSNHLLHTGMARDRAAALAADQAKSQFLARMSHELRTPLNAVIGLGHAELAGATSAESRERLGLIVDAARNLSVILDDILDLSAIQAGRIPIRPVTANVGSEIAIAAALYRPLFEADGLHLDLTLDPGLPGAAMFDPQRLRQCMSNLLSNALKHTSTGGARIDARMTAAGLLEIVVRDTGAGISPTMVERIFEPFQRGDGVEEGSGLGLSITRSLTRMMGGDLELVANAGGACFRLTLPLGAASDTTTTAPAPALPPDPGRFTVLVVDDIATNRMVALAHLRFFGLRGVEAASGAAAIEMIRKAPPDLVLLDMNMPDMDGITTLKHLRALPSRAARLPVIAMTADAAEEHRRRYLEAGMDDYLAKPLTPETLRGVIARQLGKG